jgi:hypothetical protein
METRAHQSNVKYPAIQTRDMILLPIGLKQPESPQIGRFAGGQNIASVVFSEFSGASTCVLQDISITFQLISYDICLLTQLHSCPICSKFDVIVVILRECARVVRAGILDVDGLFASDLVSFRCDSDSFGMTRGC